jgi:hypothetical protein
MLSLQRTLPVQIERLRHQLALVQKNEAFLLHAGDCAESFAACTQVRLLLAWSSAHLSLYQENISAKVGLILSFSLILTWGARLPVVRTFPQVVSEPLIDPADGGTGPRWSDCWSICQAEKQCDREGWRP